MEDQDPQNKPFLELSDDIPESQQASSSDTEEVRIDSVLEPENPLLFQARNRQRRRRAVSTLGIFSSVPRWALISLVVSLGVIMALMPQFLLIIFGIIRQIALIMRVLALPLGALFLALWLLRLFYPQGR